MNQRRCPTPPVKGSVKRPSSTGLLPSCSPVVLMKICVTLCTLSALTHSFLMSSKSQRAVGATGEPDDHVGSTTTPGDRVESSKLPPDHLAGQKLPGDHEGVVIKPGYGQTASKQPGYSAPASKDPSAFLFASFSCLSLPSLSFSHSLP